MNTSTPVNSTNIPTKIPTSIPTNRFGRAARTVAALAALGVTSGLATIVPATTASAAFPQLVIVSNHADDGTASSLRGAITTANLMGGDWTFRLDAGATYTIDRTCQSGNPDDNHGGDLDITSDGAITFQTDGAGVATLAVACVDERALDHLGDGVLALDHIRITGGNTAKGANGIQNGDRDAQDGESGGAIRSVGEVVRLTDSVLEGNRTGDGGSGAPPLFSGTGGRGGNGGIGGAVWAVHVESTRSHITGNTTGKGGAGGNGVGAANTGGNGGHGGAGTIAALDVDLTDTQIDTNSLGAGGAGGAGLGAGAPGGDGGSGGSGGGVYTTTLTMVGSTLEGNVAGSGGKGGSGNGAPGGDGGDGGAGGGAWAPTGTVVRSTIHANTSGIRASGGAGAPAGTKGAPGAGGGLAMSVGTGVTMRFSTVTSNAAEVAGNLAVAPTSSVTASIVANPSGGAGVENCSNPMISGGGNATDTASCGVGPKDHLLSLSTLPAIGDHGGLTRTVLPAPESALESMIPEAECITYLAGDITDQRGERRPMGDCEPGAAELAVHGASAYVPLAPARVFDTREMGPNAGYVGAGQTRTVQFAGTAGIPVTGVSAVAFNLTLDATAGAEYVTVSPTGQPRAFTSSVNASSAGQTVPNLVIVPLGTDGKLDFFVQRGAHLIADVVGYFTPAEQGTNAGRIMPITPARAFDTRLTPNGFVPAGGRLDVDVTGVAGVPETGVAAVVINLTGTNAGNAGYVTMWPGGTPQPFTGSLNLTRPGHTAGNMTIVPVGANGTISIYSQSGADLIGDIAGWITDGTAPYGTGGLYVPLSPTRWFDTREPAPAPGFIAAGQSRSVTVPTVAGVPAWADAILFNLTATDPAEPGFITGWANGFPMPTTSSLNLDDGALRGNAALLPVGLDSRVSFYSNMGAHLVADVYGFLTPDPQHFDE